MRGNEIFMWTLITVVACYVCAWILAKCLGGKQ